MRPFVLDGKGRKDRTVPLPQALVLNAQLKTVIRVHQEDLAAGYAGTFSTRSPGGKI